MMTDADGFGREAISKQINVSRETFDRLEAVLACLGDYRTRMNLIGPAEWDHIWRRHVADSLRLLPYISMDSRIVDLGSGGGFPALPLACVLTSMGSGHVTMIETVGKKCAFLRAAVEAAGLNATVRQGRVENCADVEANIVTARAFAPLPKLINYAAPWLEKDGIGLFHKGERWKDELTAASKEWTFAHEAIPERDGGAGIILKVSEVSRGRTQNEGTGSR